MVVNVTREDGQFSEDAQFSEELRREFSLARSRLGWNERSELDAFWRARRNRRRLARVGSFAFAVLITAGILALVLPMRSKGGSTPLSTERTLTVVGRFDTGLALAGVAASDDSVWVVGSAASGNDGYLERFGESGAELVKVPTARVSDRLVVDPSGVFVADSTARGTTTRYSQSGQDTSDLKGIGGPIAVSGNLLWGAIKGQSPDSAALVAYNIATLEKVTQVELTVGVHDLAVAGGTVFAITTSSENGVVAGSLVSVTTSGTSPVMSNVLPGVLIPSQDGVWVLNDQRQACLASVSTSRCLARPPAVPIAWSSAGLWMVDPSRHVLSLVNAESGDELATAPLDGGGPARMSPASVAVTPNGDSIWIALWDGSVEQVTVV